MCREASRPATAARAATVFPAPHSPEITPIACSEMHHEIRATASRVRGVCVQHPGREVLPERHPREPVMRAQPVNTHSSRPSWLMSRSAVAVAVGEAGVVDPVPAQLGVALLGEQLEVVDPGRCWWRWELALRLRMGVPADHERHRDTHRAVLVADLDPGQVERVEHQLDLAAHERGVDLVLV